MVFVKTFKRYKKFELWGGQNRKNSIDYLFFIEDKNSENSHDAIIAIENNKTGKIKIKDFNYVRNILPRITKDVYDLFCEEITSI
jgi:hypothetical protein